MSSGALKELDELLLNLSVEVNGGMDRGMIMYQLGRACGLMELIKDQSKSTTEVMCEKIETERFRDEIMEPDLPPYSRARLSKGGIE